jgi:Spy/CpxP family protein refolding chaperone
MKHPILIILLGLAVGTATHLAYFQHREPVATDTLEGQLAWMRTELRLTDGQFARIKELHQASRPRLRAMSAQVALMQAEFAEFERTRLTADRVDFLEFARFVESRRDLNRRCADSTRELVLASAEVMTPEQRRQYIRLVVTAEPLIGSLLN